MIRTPVERVRVVSARGESDFRTGESVVTFELMVYSPTETSDAFVVLMRAMARRLPVAVFPCDVPDPCEATSAPEVLEDEAPGSEA